MAFVAWLMAVDMANDGSVKEETLYQEMADLFIANDISCPQDLVGVDALDFKQLIPSPGKRAFVKRAVNAAAEEFKKAQAQVCALSLLPICLSELVLPFAQAIEQSGGQTGSMSDLAALKKEPFQVC